MGETPSAVDVALRALRHRDLSRRELEERLRGKGFGEAERDEALETLGRTGLVDDRRFAESRARSLAARGAGDAAVRHALGRAGVESEIVEEALETIEPEAERVLSVVARRGVGPKTARYLRGKGFSDEVVAGVVAGVSGEELG
ncbi:MAG TPA: regulatory protein RecX [Gaiellaceae bacterium]|nr:regulatory protein RecX [Gaiellaceae bacterium]